VITALILGGGKATRLGGVDKLAIIIDGRSILERLRGAVAGRVAEIIVASPRAIEGLRTVADVVPDAGPLAGIAAGLAVATTPWLLVLAGDMPDVRGEVLDLLTSRVADTADAVGLRLGMPEPLFCLLRVSAAAPHVTELLAARRYKASLLLDGLRVAWVEEPDLRAVDPELRSLRNINRPDDLG
jgi:molybdopterin-guanine dinucleotide biosynthesis protein A